MKKTLFFEQSIGIFEGGGVKGAAFAGAFKAAQDAKINFIGNIGTSAGSIVAALISAGVKSQEMIEIMNKPFSEFLGKLDTKNIDHKVKYSISQSLWGNISKIGTINYALGMYSSEEIEIWLDKTLKEVLYKNIKDKNDIPAGPVLFSHLPKSLVILATNISSGSFKCWSTKTTPYSPVAFAVRCSCTIPFFFQPVEENKTLYVDGGIIANLPLFLSGELGLDNQNPILCFRLIEDKIDKEKPKTGIDLIKLLIPSFLNSTTEVQLNMQKYRQIIDIPTGSISSIKFDISKSEIETLVNNGEKAVLAFIENEQKLVTNNDLTSETIRESLLEQTSSLINLSNHDITIFGGDLSWLKETFISLLDAALRNVKINILCEKNTSEKYLDAIKAAKSIGAEILVLDENALLKGTCIDINTDEASMIAIEEQPYSHGRLYNLPNDSGFIRLIRDTYKSKWNTTNLEKGESSPKLVAIHETKLIETLKKNVPAYRDCHIYFETVEVEKLQPLNKFLEYLKLKRVKQLNKILSKAGLSNGAFIVSCPWVIIPPIIEKIKTGELIILDGTHRVYDARQSNQTQMKVMIVENVSVQLPSKISSWDTIIVEFEKKTREERYIDYNASLFRPIETAFNNMTLT